MVASASRLTLDKPDQETKQFYFPIMAVVFHRYIYIYLFFYRCVCISLFAVWCAEAPLNCIYLWFLWRIRRSLSTKTLPKHIKAKIYLLYHFLKSYLIIYFCLMPFAVVCYKLCLPLLSPKSKYTLWKSVDSFEIYL